MKPKGKLKIPAVRVASDDCSISIGQVMEDGEITVPGTPHYVHVGEWIEVMPVIAVKEVMQLSRLQRGGEESGALGESLGQLCQELSKRLLAWNWTDLMGEKMEQPYNRPDVLERLASEELMWLMSAASSQESADERKKDSKKSADTSLEMALNPTMSPSE